MNSPSTERFEFVEGYRSLGSASAMPYLPIVLVNGDRELAASGLVDSGATLNVLPYDLGLQLGFIWEQQTVQLPLTGNLLAPEELRLYSLGESAASLRFVWPLPGPELAATAFP